MKAGHRQKIETLMGARVSRIDYLPGGCVGEVWRVVLENSYELVAKTAAGEDSLDIEAFMLRYLKTHSSLPVPGVLGSTPDLLIIEMVENDHSSGGSVDADAARLLAKLHDVSAPQFGLEEDTLIGPLPQPNVWHDNWLDFFAEQRLLYVGRLALDKGALPAMVYQKLEKLCERLEQYLVEPDKPSLLHGDVWGGNVLTKSGKIAAFIDPAIYFGHREVELAYTTMFNTFGPSFFDSYGEFHQLENEFFDIRMPIYHLYPLLVHVALFGGSYVRETDDIISRFVS